MFIYKNDINSYLNNANRIIFSKDNDLFQQDKYRLKDKTLIVKLSR
jgi:hypothetical protein